MEQNYNPGLALIGHSGTGPRFKRTLIKTKNSMISRAIGKYCTAAVT